MKRQRWQSSVAVGSILGIMLVATAGGCGGADSASAEAAGANGAKPRPQTPLPIEESDLVQKKGDLLYVQNERSGLNVIDISDLHRPRVLGQAPVTGPGGELYLRDDHAIVLMERAGQGCRYPDQLGGGGWDDGSQVVFVDVTHSSTPRIVARNCIPGRLVASRAVGDALYIVANDEAGGSRIYALDISVPARARLVEQLDFPQASKEIHVTQNAIYVAGPAPTERCEAFECTRVQMVTILPRQKSMRLRGSAVLPGLPQGRFHMDARNGQFRIVTYERTGSRSTTLHILDITDPDHLQSIGHLPNIGGGEKLYATRFTEYRAYVVTYRQTDPLWIIDLRAPSAPKIVGSLQIPGWSDFIFPRGDTLLTVGRGARGAGFGVSLFDVSDPRQPRPLRQLTFGGRDTTSEANFDHRAVTIIQREAGSTPLLVVPYSTTSYDWQAESCDVTHRVQLVDVDRDTLRGRGSVAHDGAVRRTLVHRGALLAVSERQLQAIDIGDRDRPLVSGQVAVSNVERDTSSCSDHSVWLHDDVYEEDNLFVCGVDPSTPASAAWPLGLILLLLVAARRRSF